jgi:hypothetical protein
MFRNTNRLARQLATATTVIALAVPAVTASAARPVLNSGPGSEATAIGAQREQRDYVDLRSPDAKDAGSMADTSSPTPSVQAPGFDWGDAGIGAGSALGLLLIILSGMFAVVHRRSRRVDGRGGTAVTT